MIVRASRDDRLELELGLVGGIDVAGRAPHLVALRQSQRAQDRRIDAALGDDALVLDDELGRRAHAADGAQHRRQVDARQERHPEHLSTDLTARKCVVQDGGGGKMSAIEMVHAPSR